MKAVILAGGKGTRLAPYTHVLPKPLVPVGDMPILEIVIRQLIDAGFDDITLTLGHLGEIIRAFLAARREFASRATIRFVDEVEPTGTAGSLALVPGLDETFLAMNGDVLTSLDYRSLVDHHRRAGAALTIAGHRKEVRIDLGVLQLDERGQLTDYIEKPEYTFPVSMGVYVYEPGVLQHIPPGGYFDFPALVHALLAAGERVVCYESRDLWLDIGRHEDHALAQQVFAANQGKFGFAGSPRGQGGS